MVLQHAPDNAAALILGLAKVYLAAGEPEQAQATLDMLPEDARKGDDYTRRSPIRCACLTRPRACPKPATLEAASSPPTPTTTRPASISPWCSMPKASASRPPRRWWR